MTMDGSHSDGVFEDAVRRLDMAARYSHIDPEALERMKHPKAVVEVSLPVRMDDGLCRFSRDTGSVTTIPAAPPKAASAFIQTYR
jgi:hypothetical protein